MHRSDEKKRFIFENRTVKLLSDAVDLMPEKFKKETEFVRMIVGVNKTNVESVFRQIDEKNFKKTCEIIDFSVEIRPLEVDSFLKLVSLISSKFGVDNLPNFSNYFRMLLNARGILPQPKGGDKECDEVFTEFATSDIEQTIREDNVEQFCELISVPTFNAKNKVNFLPVNKGSCMMNEYASYIQLIAYFGAINCFKQAIMNDAFELDDISKYAIAGGSNEIVRIIEQKGISFDNCFEVAVKYHRMDLCDWLLMHTRCESINLSLSLGCFNYPAFFFTMINEKSFNNALFTALEKCNIEVIKYLIEQCGVNVESKDDIGRTPLHITSFKGHIEVIKYLIEQCRANVEAKNNTGRTPLHFASENGHIKVVKYLIERCHANVEAKDYLEGTPLHFASENGHIEVVKYLIERCHANVEAKDYFERTPLHFASEKGRIEVVKYLIERCHANVEVKDNNGNTPLHFASENGHIEVVKYLIEQCHANVEEKGYFESTPLHYASEKGRIEVVKYLIEQCHANAEAKDYFRSTALDRALCEDIKEYLRRIKSK
jgi:ankyrin repeat protein